MSATPFDDLKASVVLSLFPLLEVRQYILENCVPRHYWGRAVLCSCALLDTLVFSFLVLEAFSIQFLLLLFVIC
jgi:hypothetical protein